MMASQKIGINGDWYDISGFVDKHPGGKQVIQEYINKDATVVFRVHHSINVLQKYSHLISKMDKYQLNIDPLDRKLLKVHNKLLMNNSYKTDRMWIASKIMFILVLFTTTYFGLHYTLQWNDDFRYYLRFIFSFCLTIAWQQCGLLMHDCMHSSITHNRHIDSMLGFMFGNIGFGINAKWWKEDHNVHHVFTNTIDPITKTVIDPQAQEIVFAQSEKMFHFPFYNQAFIQKIMIGWQQYTWIPLCVFVSRFGIIIDSYITETNVFQWFGLFLHIIMLWQCYLIQFDSMLQAFIWYYIACCGQGILSFQLLVSHYDKPFYDKEDSINGSWFKRQSLVVKDIINPIWMDWFFGGLNFHLTHHSLPRLPRHKTREVDAELRNILKTEGIEIDRVHFHQAIIDCIIHLGNVAKEYGAWHVIKQA